jgi:hypothetical protein
MAGLKEVIEKLGAGYVGVGRNAPPEVAANEGTVIWAADE